MPNGKTLLQQAWAWAFFFFEDMNNFSSTMVYFFLSRTKDRSADADAAQNSPLLAAPVDVFIATYNEPESVLERTIIGAMAIDHPDLRVFVLDDGARGFVRDLAHELGAHYVCRVKGKHAKAGKGLMQRRRRHPVELSLAVRPRSFGNFPWHPYQHLRLFGAGRRARLWGQCVLEYLQHRGSASGGGGLGVELPQQRLHARLPASEPGVIRGQGQPDSVCTIVNLSLGGAKLAGPPPGWARSGEEGVLQLPFRFVRLDQRQGLGHGFGIVFEAEIPLRRALTARLFTGAYRSTIDDIEVPQVLFAVGKRLLR
jgi:hypothetical protein